MQIEGKIWPPIRGIQDGEYKLIRTINALVALGSPHLKLQNIVHIGGTNGKGSTISFIKNILNTHGYSTNVYTSPHLVKVNERIQVKSTNIEDEPLQKYANEVYFKLKQCNLQDTLTYFEGLTVIAFYIFAKEIADFNIIEVGLGGRFDATNVIENPLLSVITSISMDHQDYLGNTPELIALEKAEIIKPKSVTVIGLQKAQSIYNIFEKKAQEVHAKCVFCTNLRHISPHIDVSYQKENANLALLTMHEIGIRLGTDFNSEKSINAINNTIWAGRLQRITINSIGKEIMVDCAHNIDGIAKFLQYILACGGSATIVFGMLKRKITPEIATLLHTFLKNHSYMQIITTNFEGHDECANCVELSHAINHEMCWHSVDVITAIKSAKYENVYICGSIHFIGDVMQKYC